MTAACTNAHGYGPKDLEDAIDAQDVDTACAVFVALTGSSVRAVALDDDDPVLYAAVVDSAGVRGVCAYVNPDLELVVVPEADGPLFVGCPAPLIGMLDSTFGERAVRWRRDCLARFYRSETEQLRLGHPAWTAFYSEAPLGSIRHPCHLAVVTGGAPHGLLELAITDGTAWRGVRLPLEQLQGLVPLWPLEWTTNGHSLMAMRGRGALRYLGVGPPDYRVGMLFNDLGGLLGWSGAASHCELMATVAQTTETGFSRVMLLNQLSRWQGRSVTA